LIQKGNICIQLPGKRKKIKDSVSVLVLSPTRSEGEQKEEGEGRQPGKRKRRARRKRRDNARCTLYVPYAS